MARLSLRVRLFISYAAVVAAGATTFVLVTRLVAPQLFDDRVRRMGRFGRQAGGAATDPGLHDALTSALNAALAAALAASLVLAVVVAVVVARRLLRPLDELRRATRRLAQGHYDDKVSLPAERELAALAADVNELAAVLDTTERRRAALIGDVAHELRTPVTTIRGYVEGLADGMFSKDEAVAAVSEELSRLERLAADLAAASRAEEGRLEMSLADDDLTAVVRDVVGRLRPQFDDKGVALAVDLAPQAPVRGDHERLVQLVTNVIGNALTYTETGGTVTVSTAAGAGQCRVVVADTGAGLAPEDLERVFERFYRVGGRGRSGGTGIGLTIARAIARAHHGDLVARSPGPGRGSTFELSIPLLVVPSR